MLKTEGLSQLLLRQSGAFAGRLEAQADACGLLLFHWHGGNIFLLIEFCKLCHGRADVPPFRQPRPVISGNPGASPEPHQKCVQNVSKLFWPKAIRLSHGSVCGPERGPAAFILADVPDSRSWGETCGDSRQRVNYVCRRDSHGKDVREAYVRPCGP